MAAEPTSLQFILMAVGSAIGMLVSVVILAWVIVLLFKNTKCALKIGEAK